jgi:predicted transcriptional regulator
MATERVNDLRAFRDFADAKLSNGGSEMTLEEALSLWEYENSPEEEREETLEAIRRGFADIEAGRVRPAREALEELRRKHKLPPLS